MLRQAVSSRLLVLITASAILAGCAQTRPPAEPPKQPELGAEKGPSNYKVGKPYQIKGVWYYPSEDYSYDETGIASWYGPDFHGQYTANGEIFDQNNVSAAHRTLPMPSFVRVTNLDNGRELVVRVNDRGPFAHGRILDLSRRAAQLLGIEGKGTAKVRVQILADESRAVAMRVNGGRGEGGTPQADEPPVQAAARVSVSAEALPPPPGGKEAGKPAAPPPAPAARQPEPRQYASSIPEPQVNNQQVKVVPVKAGRRVYVQAGSFSRHDYANRMQARLANIGSAGVSHVHVNGNDFYRVRLGPVKSVEEADQMLEKVIASGYPDARIIVD